MHRRSLSTLSRLAAERGPPVAANIYSSFAAAVGNTPLIRLRSASERTECNIYAKCEFMSIGGSIKDRAGAWLVADGEDRGILTHGKPGIIIEATAGNTGIGLTLAANARGYRTVIVIPDTQAQEKKDVLRNCGAHLIEVPAYPFTDSRNYVHFAARLAKLLKQHSRLPVFLADQWANMANRRAHLETTGPEILAQLAHIGLKPDAFSCAMGTGGTLTGVSEYLKERVPGFKSYLTDPEGAIPFSVYSGLSRVFTTAVSITEGVGQGRMTGNMKGYVPDHAWEIPDTDALAELSTLCIDEGLQVGLSSGINVAGAITVAKHLGPGHTIVTMLCDSASRYNSKMYNPAFLRGKGLPVPIWLDKERAAEVSVEAMMGVNMEELMERAREGKELCG